MTTHDVVIVGAGLAGLRAAQVLTRRGVDVVILDGADRAGGRIATDVVDGFRLDRGFQVLNTSYPALRAAFGGRLELLRLRTFESGAAIRGTDGLLHTFSNPARRPSQAFATATDGLLPVWDKAKLVAWTARVLGSPPQRTATLIDRSAAQEFAAAGLDGPVVERLLRPFLAGVLGESALTTSSAYVRLLWRSFAIGTIAVPGGGMGALPARLASTLPAGTIRLGRSVTDVRPGVVHTSDEELTTRAVVVATDPVTAGRLLPGLATPDMLALTTYYHVPPVAPTRSPLLHLDAAGGPIANTVVLTAAATEYAPAGQSLVSSTVLGGHIDETVVRRELARIYGVPTGDWAHLHTSEIREALPAFPAGRPLRSDVVLGDGLFVAGDHRDTPSQQGALVSGRRAAEAVLLELGR